MKTARDVLGLLLTRHAKDVCVTECKDGPSQYATNHSRLDLWTMKRSWTDPRITGYEIKVGRSDFLRDDKWRSYLPMCNQLYFAVRDNSVIRPDEVPAECGLLVAAGSRMMTKKKAPLREIPFPEGVARYVLMSRVTISRHDLEDNIGYWTEWLENRRREKEIGSEVAAVIGRVRSEEMKRLAARQGQLDSEIKQLAGVRDWLKEAGIRQEIGQWACSDATLRNLKRKIGLEMAEDLRRAIDRLDEFMKAGGE